MRKKYFYLLGLIGLGGLMQHCTKQEIQPYSGGHYVQFTVGLQDTTDFSFFFYPGKNELEFPLPIRLVGNMPTEDLVFDIEVDTEHTTATSAEFELPSTFKFRAGLQQDTAYVRLKNHAGLLTNGVQLALRIKDNAQVKAGQSNFVKRVFNISDKISKPVWWDANMDRFYLGVYSELKFRKFMEVTGVGDLEPHNEGERRILILKFKYYLIEMKGKGTPVLLEDGSDMLASVPVIG